MLATRILTALALLPAVLWALFGVAHPGWPLFALLVVAIGAFEWAALIGWHGLHRGLYAAAVVAACMLLVAFLAPPQAITGRLAPLACAAGVVFWLAAVPWWLSGRARAPRGGAGALVGVAVLLPAWVALVALQQRSPWVALAAMAIVWAADTAAYFAGRAFGRRKLAPSISPGKTWEGVIGALCGVAVYVLVLFALAVRYGQVDAGTFAAAALWVLFGLGIAGMSIVGDLFESLLKRQAGVKDSGRILPGHGGLLDRIDALLPAMPAAALAATVLLR
jgi:phosphatidate cytidylyltransferase